MNNNAVPQGYWHHWLLLSSLACLVLPLGAAGAPVVALATAPLATATTSSVKANLMFILDNSGSMDWQHMPDDKSDGGSSVPFSFGYYGLRSSQCNQVYYDPNTVYSLPVHADGTPYPPVSFTYAPVDGYKYTCTATSANCINLSTNFKASTDLNGDPTGQPAYYYAYSGAQISSLQKNYNNTSNTFSTECGNSAGSTDASGKILSVAPATGAGGVFTKVTFAASGNSTYTLTFTGTGSQTISSVKANGVELLIANSPITQTDATMMAQSVQGQINFTSGTTGYKATLSGNDVIIAYPTGAGANQPIMTYSNTGNIQATVTANSAAPQNFATWYSFYRTRLLMMKSAAGIAFKALDDHYRVGYMSINTSSDFLNVAPFNSTQKALWYGKLYNDTTNGSTPLREALANAGLYYAHKLSFGTGVVVNDPVEYSCQQNFTILSTDGFWNGNAGYQVDKTAVGNQDGSAPRPLYDGAASVAQTKTNYTQNRYSSVNSNCGNGKFKVRTQPENFSCTAVTVNGALNETCTTPTNNGNSTTATTCSSALPVPNPSARVVTGTPINTTVVSGGTSDTLADVAMYYYQTDLRDAKAPFNNCTGALGSGIDVCTPNVFKTATDTNEQQHMTTFTLGLGASGRMIYSKDYESATKVDGDFYSVLKGLTADSTATTPICAWQVNGTICNWPVPGDGKIENIDDLWHTAVDGHGSYYSATSPKTLAEGIADALQKIDTRTGATGAAATSSQNPTNGNNYAYVASYITLKWVGNLEEHTINTQTGAISETASWCLENLTGDPCLGGRIDTKDISATATRISYCVRPATTQADCTTASGIYDQLSDPLNPTCSVEIPIDCTGTMPNRVGPTLNQGSVCYNNNDCDTRLIYTASSSSSTTPSLIEFTATNFAGSASFAPAQLSQWTTFTAAQKSAATPATLVNYLRGRVKFDTRSDNLITDTTTTPATVTDNRLYRKREATIGDAIESQPAFISKPVFIYPDSGYSTFIADHANRVGTIYMGSNDGAVHAITALEEGTSPNIVPGGTERWAYIPSMVWANLHKLADTNYALNHSNFVNGSPVIADIYCTAACPGGITPAWRTILVGGLNAGGRGYYALDITDPNLPMLLWEFTADKAGPYGDPDLGYSFGNPVITARSNDNRWVVMFTSGYDNTTGTNPGKGYLYVLDPVTGAALSKIGTGSGSSASPSGLSKIAAWNDVPSSNRATWVYGGDLDGNVWRFDITNPTTQPLLFATLNDPSGNPQPVTTAPVLGLINNKRTIFVATGKYLETADLSNTQVQSLYAIMDDRAPLSNPGGSPRNSTNLIQQFLTLDTTTGKRKSSNNAVDFSKFRGWYVDFPESGERVNIESKLLFGTLLVATLVPSNTVCSPGGHAWLNYFDYQTGGALDNSGFASSPYKSPIVGINDLAINGETLIEVTTDLIPTVNRDPPIKAQVGGFGSNRVLWREWNP